MKKRFWVLCFCFIIVGIIAACGNHSVDNERDSTITYARLRQVLSSLNDNIIIPCLGEEEITGKKYWTYKNDEITVMIEHTEEVFTEYQFYAGNELLCKKDLRYDSRDFSKNELYYIDINQDGSKDLILKIDFSGGTDNDYHWMEAYDLKNMKKINLFSEENYLLTKEQEEQLETLLKDNVDFQKKVGRFEYYGPYVDPYVDASGNVYLYLSIAKEPQIYPAEICVYLKYCAEKDVFEVHGYDYCLY